MLKIPKPKELATANWRLLASGTDTLFGFEGVTLAEAYDASTAAPDEVIRGLGELYASLETAFSISVAEETPYIYASSLTGALDLFHEHMISDDEMIVGFNVPVVIDEEAAPLDAADKPIWEVFEEIMARVPSELLDNLPIDGASEHDHYLYGTPKRRNDDCLC
jgi:hypothetical protein